MPSSNLPGGPPLIFALLALFLFISPAFAFGAGNIADASGLEGYNWRHGDIVDVLLSLPISFQTRRPFLPRQVSTVYFGNWMRDYSQLFDASTLTKVPEPVIRAIVSVLGFMEFSYATREFDVTRDRIGVYRPEEHIDNPKGYAASLEGQDASKVDPRLRGPVNEEVECGIDPETGMKNYIANEKLGISTSSAYIRRQLEQCIRLGRGARKNKNDEELNESLIHLGAGLHCLEDFAAHSNYVELALCLIGQEQPDKYPGLSEVFQFCSDGAKVETRKGKVAPIVTGTFGMADLYQSILGEVDDKTAARNLSELELRLSESTSVLNGAINELMGSVRVLKLLGLDANIYDTIKGLQQNSTNQAASPVNWGDLQNQPNYLWQQIEPIFKLRDDIQKTVMDSIAVLAIRTELAKISEALDRVVYSLLAPFIKPTIDVIREIIGEEKEKVLKMEQEKATESADIFGAGAKGTDPSHTQLAKDHFDNILNAPAGLVAAIVTNLTTQAVVNCWDNENVDQDAVISNILETLHHPFNATSSSHVQMQMLAVVKRWWDVQGPKQQAIRERLTKQAVMAGRNRVSVAELGEARDLRDLTKFEGSHPEVVPLESELPPVLGKIVDNVKEVVGDGIDKFIGGVLKEVSPQNVNPIDRALAGIAADVTRAFDNIPLADIRSMPIGTLLKEAVATEISEGARKIDNFASDLSNSISNVTREVSKWFPWS